jgi:AraC-like DNA-binding protein
VPRELQKRVESVVVVESDEMLVNVLPPNPAVVLSYRLRGLTTEETWGAPTPIPRLGLSGVNVGPRVVRYQPGSAMLLVRFRVAGAADLFEGSLHETAGSSHGLEDLVSSEDFHRLAERMESSADGARARQLTRFLAHRLPTVQPDTLIQAALDQISLSRGQVRIAELVRTLGTNADSLEKRFRQKVGVTPKVFARLVRFQRFVAQAPLEDSFGEIAVRAGYYDQAHLIREFRSLTGESPSVYLSRPPAWSVLDFIQATELKPR